MSDSTHAPIVPDPDPATLPQDDGSSLSGAQLIGLMGVALLIALVFLDVVSG